MAVIKGSSEAIINAPIDKVWAVLEDVEASSLWQSGIVSVKIIERSETGLLVECVADAKVKKISSTVKFDLSGAPTRMDWKQIKGEAKDASGHWQLQDLGNGTTKAFFESSGDTGRVLGLVIKGPIADFLSNVLAGTKADELKNRVEQA